MTTCDTGDVVLVQFPFTDLAATKQRPAVVISPTSFHMRHGDCVLMPLTTQRQSNAALGLTRWKQAGLLKPTWVKPLVATLSLGLLVRSIGKLQAEDDPSVRAALAEAVDARW